MRSLAVIGGLAGALLVGGCASGHDLGHLRGRVVDAESGRTLGRVHVVLDEATRIAADERGRFTLPDTLAGGVLPALIVGRECRWVETEIAVPAPGAGALGDVPVSLPPDPRVLAAPPPPDDSPGRLVSASEIEAMGVERLSDVVRRVAPEMIGGASGDPGRGSELRGRGSPTGRGDRVPVVVVDGVAIHARSTAPLDDIPAMDVAWLEILPGAVAGWEYGTGGAGGILKIQTKQGSAEILESADCPLPPDWPVARDPMGR